MKKVFTVLIITILSISTLFAQTTKNNSADNIIGTYEGVQNGFKFRAKIEKEASGNYKAQVIWLENDRDKNGNKYLDEKNPDKSLRKTPCDRVVLIKDLKYISSKKHWGDTKIYDPLRGFKAKVECSFTDDKTLKIKGSLLGISETVYWKKLS